MFSYGGRWAHAHDNQQDLFMRLAAVHVAANPGYREIPWFHAWSRNWMEAAGNQGNGCSDLLADDYLTDEDRVATFRRFLRDYRAWIGDIGPILEDEMRVVPDRAIAFAELLDAVLAGDESHPKVNRRDPALG